MISIYTKNIDNIEYPIKKYSKFDYIKRRYLSELNKVKDYYKNKDRAVDNRHMLSRIIKMIVPDVYMDDIEYINIISSSSIYVSKQFDIVSNIHSGKIMENVLFGNNSYEIFLYTDSNIDIFNFKDSWLEYDSVRVIYTDNTDLNMDIPFNNADYILPVLNIMNIDIIAMCLQYKYLALERIKNDYSTDVNVFVSQIVLPNMLDNILDLAIYNRFNKIVNNEEIGDFDFKHPFVVLDYSKGIDNILKKVYKDTYNVSYDIEQIYLTIPTIVNDNMLDALHINNRYFTKQSSWVLWLGRIHYIANMLKLLSNKGMNKNKSLLTKLPYLLKEVNRSKTLENKLNNLAYIETNMLIDLDYISETIGKR